MSQTEPSRHCRKQEVKSVKLKTVWSVQDIFHHFSSNRQVRTGASVDTDPISFDDRRGIRPGTGSGEICAIGFTIFCRPSRKLSYLKLCFLSVGNSDGPRVRLPVFAFHRQPQAPSGISGRAKVTLSHSWILSPTI